MWLTKILTKTYNSRVFNIYWNVKFSNYSNVKIVEIFKCKNLNRKQLKFTILCKIVVKYCQK